MLLIKCVLFNIRRINLLVYASGAAKKTRDETSTGQCDGRHEQNPQLLRNHYSGRTHNFREQSRKLLGHRKHVGDGDCLGGNFLAVVAMQAWFDTSLRDPLKTSAQIAKYLKATIQTEKVFIPSQSNEIMQHAISFTQYSDTRNIRTPRYDCSVTTRQGPHIRPHDIIVYGPPSVMRRHRHHFTEHIVNHLSRSLQ